MCAPSRFLINKRDICLQLSRLFRRFSMSVSDLRFGFPSTSQLPQRSTLPVSAFRFPFSAFPKLLNCLNAQRLNSLPVSAFRFQFSALGFPLWVSPQRLNTLTPEL